MAKDPEPRKLSIVIVGGSLGGLFTGIALKRLGHATTILERNPTALLHNQGAGIVAGGDTLDFFSKHDRTHRPLAVGSHRRIYLDRSGSIIHREDMPQNMTSWDLAYYVLRANYDGVESAYCKVPPKEAGDGEAVHLHGHAVTGLREEGEGVRVEFKRHEDGSEGSMFADLVVGADGPNSTVRQLFAPDVRRTYAGYCALRGTVPEDEASAEAREVFQERFAFFHGPGRQILAYLIPGLDGSVEPGSRLINFVYYTNFPADSDELDRLMTDTSGTRHRLTIPPGKLDPAVWQEQVRLAEEWLPPQFAEVVRRTKKPFCQAVTDVMSPSNEFLGGRVVLVGDALAGFRPHTVASTSQAAFDAMQLADMVGGRISREEWRKGTMQFARLLQKRGMDMGRRSQFEDLPLEEHIDDRNRASRPRQEEVYPEWTYAKESVKCNGTSQHA